MSDKRQTPPLPTLWPEELAAVIPGNRWLVEASVIVSATTVGAAE